MFRLEAPEIQTYAVIPGTPPEAADKVLHATLPIAGSRMMFSDGPPDFVSTKGNSFAVCLGFEDKEEIKRIYEELSADGEILHPLEKTFFSELYCMFIDKFGIKWQLTAEI